MASKGEKHVNLGAFSNEKQAALAWDVEARRQGRSDSDLNFPDEIATKTEILGLQGYDQKWETWDIKVSWS